MICPPCANAADAFTDGGSPPHSPQICRDIAIQPGGCACQHGRRTPRPDPPPIVRITPNGDKP